MLTQCPNCHARAKLPDDRAGAKVRCPECGRVFVARADEGAAKARTARLGLVVLVMGGLAALLALVGLVFSLQQSKSPSVSAADTAVTSPSPADD